MNRDRFTPYSCTFSGKIPQELWMDYDEAEAIAPDADEAPADDRQPETELTEPGSLPWEGLNLGVGAISALGLGNPEARMATLI
ncbi:MAG: hypothetical protein HC812_10905 [Leptolyngbya sp. RL_3_1]|nr:hypothetical protein [Leptolyngbya sp. RL_3_1]